MKILIQSPLAVLLPDPEQECSGILIERGRIEKILGFSDDLPDDIDQIIDASDCVVTPGLINTHHHYYQTLTRALPVALNKELFPWLKSLYPVWAGLDADMITAATQMAAAELLLSGCTTSSDHHYIFPSSVTDALDVQVAALANTGIRSVLTRGSMSLGEDQGGLPPRNTVQDEDTILADSERVITTYHDAGDSAFLNIALAPCSPFSVSESLMKESAKLARRYGVRLHTHLAETHDETAFCLRVTGYRPLDYLEHVNWLANDVWLAHGIHFNDNEVTRLGAAGVGITHCPSSNMILGSGQCPTLELESAGCPVGLGVDGSASNDGSNMIQEVRQALLLQRLRYGASKMTHIDALRMATSGSAKCIGRPTLGEIRPGFEADLALFKLDEPRFSGAGDPLAALLLCGASQAEHVMVGGKWSVYDKQLTTMDIDELTVRHRACARMLTQT